MTDLTVQRTLVKSPPELWSELSEVEGLARHLGEFGEIRITRAAPETTVAWEGEHASGTVEIEAAGWGTKVTLTAAVAGAPLAEPVEPEVEPVRLSEELDRIAERAQASYWDELVHWGEPEVEATAPTPRRSRFARFFRRRPRRESIEEALAAERLEDAGDTAVETAVAERTAVTAAPAQTAPAQTVAEEAPDGIEPDHARAVLEHALDNLGAAHHRPFSRG
jgi:hypothetical protein